MVGATVTDAKNVIDRIRDLFSSLQFESGLEEGDSNGKYFGSSFSAGVASMDGRVPASLKAADEALYRAKHGGRNRVEVYD